MSLPASYLRRWRPEQHHKTGHLPGTMPGLKEDSLRDARICPGSIIAWSDRRAYEVVEITERPADLWPQHFRDEWDRYYEWRAEHTAAGRLSGPGPDRATWEHRPLVLVIRPADKPHAKVTHYAVRASRTFIALPEHYSVCRLCNEIPPCNHATLEATIDHEMAHADRLMAIPRGACLGCGETITSRMKATRFPGPNLWRPDWGQDSAVFHTRQREECSNGLWRYEQQWKQQGLDVLNPQLPAKEA